MTFVDLSRSDAYCVILLLLGWTAIHEASNGGFTDVILELLKAGADVNSRSHCGVLPIHDAVSGNYLEVYFSFTEDFLTQISSRGSAKQNPHFIEVTNIILV